MAIYTDLFNAGSIGTNTQNTTSIGWNTRCINNQIIDQIGINPQTLSGHTYPGRFTLPTGIYNISSSAKSWNVAHSKLALFDVSSSTYVAYGLKTSLSTDNDATSIIDTVITVTSTRSFEIRHYTHSSQSGGLGYSNTTAAGPETYFIMRITQLAG